MLSESLPMVLGQRSAHYRVEESFLLDHNGALIRAVPQSSNTIDFRVSNDGELIWIISEHVLDRKPFGQVKVVNSQGDELRTIEFHEPKDIELKYKGTTYKINVKAPKIPG